MSVSTIKSKTAAKTVITKSHGLDRIVSKTLDTIAEIVGGTLGPGGHPVLIERSESGTPLPPILTKDGVTVFRALGFQDAVAHSIMESARDASVRTANEAGDGTTSATILAQAMVKHIHAYIKNNPGVSSHWIVSEIQKTFDTEIAPLLRSDAIRTDLVSEEGRRVLKAVAKLSANGDEALATATMQCFDITGDDGNVTITEQSGDECYKVEKIEGFPIAIGLEQCAQRYSTVFMNDAANQRLVMDSPLFILNFGQIVDFNGVLGLLMRVNDAWKGKYLKTWNVVLVATGFSETVLAQLASIFSTEGSINVYPLVVPTTPISNSQREFLEDLSAVVNAKVLDPLTAPMETATFEDLGNITANVDEQNQTIWEPSGVTSFESSRFRSSLVGYVDADDIMIRADEVRVQLEHAASQMDASFLQERLAKLTGGIAKLKVVGSSTGSVKERRDRAEDAVCAVRGALKLGALVGGGWTALKVIDSLSDTPINKEIVVPSLMAPVIRLQQNSGVHANEIDAVIAKMRHKGLKGVPQKKATVRDASKNVFVNGVDAGILDSFGAQYESLKNAISIASVLGTIGGAIVFPRDRDFEIQEARDRAEFDKILETFDPNDR